MNKKIEDLLQEFSLEEMLTIQVNSLELMLKKNGLAEQTINRKISNFVMFMLHLKNLRKNKINVKFDNISNLAFEYVRDGYFTSDDREGSKSYRKQIYNNIRQGFNYVYEDMKDILIMELTKWQDDILEEVSVNNWFRVDTDRDNSNFNDNLQVELLKRLGLKVYFDDNNKPYVLSHELADNLDKRNVDLMDSVDKIIKEFNECEFTPVAKSTDFTMINDFYVDSKGEKRPTMKIYKDLTIKYVLGLSPRKTDKNYKQIIQFQYSYVDAFNFIEEEHKKLLEKHAELKDSFLEMYNKIRKMNRDLLCKK